MKRKLFILGTLGLAGLFAGGVVAAYTIADNAEKSGIKITPGTIVDDEVGNVTLEWGDMASFSNVSGLRVGTPITRSVNVKATVKNESDVVQADAVYLGKLDVELKDLSGKAPSAERLIDYLHVDINGYDYQAGAFAAEKSKLGEIPTDLDEFNTSIGVYSNKDGKPVDFVISLDSAATPVMGEIMTDQVYLTVDWNRGDNSDTGMKHVFIPDNGWSNMYVYSYTAEKQNADWPGVQFTRNAENGLFEGYLADHDYFIFNDGSSNQYPASGESGMTKASLNYTTAAAIYFDWSTHTFTSTAPVVLAPYYLVGEPTGWDMQAAFGFELHDDDKPEGTEHQYKLIADVVTGKEYKLRASGSETWLGYGAIEEGCRSLVSGSDNFTFNAAGSYTFYIKELSAGGHSVYIAQNA
jgi:hypothetical protein